MPVGVLLGGVIWMEMSWALLRSPMQKFWCVECACTNVHCWTRKVWMLSSMRTADIML